MAVVVAVEVVVSAAVVVAAPVVVVSSRVEWVVTVLLGVGDGGVTVVSGATGGAE